MAIRWTRDEYEVIAARAAELRGSGYVGKPLALVKEAQLVLPESRHRHIFQIQQVPPRLRLLIDVLYKPGVHLGNTMPPPPPPNQEEPPVIAAKPGSLDVRAPTDEEVLRAVVNYGKQILHNLVANAVKEALEAFLEHPTVKDYMAPGLRVKPDMPKVTFTPPPQPETMRGPRIAVVGMPEPKTKMAYELVDNTFPLKVWDARQSGGKVADTVRWSFRCLVNTRAISHPIMKEIQASGAWDKVILCDGDRVVLNYLDMYVREYKSNLKIPAKNVRPTQGATNGNAGGSVQEGQ